jgi:hypothetical protein
LEPPGMDPNSKWSTIAVVRSKEVVHINLVKPAVRNLRFHNIFRNSVVP